MSSVRDFISGAARFGGTGSDGAFAPGANYSFSDTEGDWVIKQYSSITINNGETISATNRIAGLILYCSGNVVIDGEIDLDGKGYGSEQAPPIVYDRYYSSGVLKSAWAEYCSSVRGGDGGGGGGATQTATGLAGGDGEHAGGGGAADLGVVGGNASGWIHGLNTATNGHFSYGGALNCPGDRDMADPSYGGGAGYLGVQNAGGNAGEGGEDETLGVNATLTTSECGNYGGALLVIIAKGSITIGSTANIHCEGEPGSNLSSPNGCDGGGGGGCVVLLSESAEPDIDGSATISVDGGAGGDNSADGGGSPYYGGDGGDGDAGTIVYDMVE